MLMVFLHGNFLYFIERECLLDAMIRFVIRLNAVSTIIPQPKIAYRTVFLIILIRTCNTPVKMKIYVKLVKTVNT